ncbi:AEC family transporter [Halobium salinum]|uniref:AEC family transporter n=1 Tax=Halobium salinum TaxID=1364940 RepID=A0ABD5P764_9EURY|nr:AEC family transporter [Halobium salinum]
MSDLFSVFATAILPIVAIAGVGYLLGRRADVDPGPLNTVTVYVLAPALVLHSLATTDLAGGALARIGGGVVAYSVLMLGLAEAVGRLRGETAPLLGAFTLSSTFPNAGNFGIPVSAFAFGAVGRSTAVVYIAVEAMVMYTVGVVVASRGRGSRFDGVGQALRVPLVYAVAAALLARYLGVVPPVDSAAMSTLKLVGDASIPVMLLILGLQLARRESGTTLRSAVPASVLKLGVAPVVAVGIALALGFENADVARVFVLECAMPAAVTPLVLVAEFSPDGTDGRVAEYVSTVVLVTTLASVPLLTGLIVFLQAGVVF